MHHLSILDYVIIIGYLLVSLVAGLMMTKRAGSSLEHYFLGGRSLPWYLLGVAGMANWFDLTGTMIITSFLYMLGPRGLYVEFRGGACLVLPFLLAYAGKWHRRSGCMTQADWMTYRFGVGRAAEGVRLLTALMGILSTVMMLAYLIRGTTLFLGMFFPFPPMWTTFVLILFTTLYTVSAGFYGVVLTDLVQGFIIIVSSVIVAFMAWHMVPNPGALGVVAQQVTDNTQWTDSQISWHTTMPPGYEAYQSLVMVAFFYLMRNVLGGMGGGAESRYFAARDDKECGLQSLLQGLMVMFRWPLMIGFAVLGIYLVQNLYPDSHTLAQTAALIHSHYPHITAANWHDLTSLIVNSPSSYPPDLIQGLRDLLGPDWANKLPLVGINGTVNPEEILPAVLLNQVPSGLKGCLVVAMFAAMMSCKNGMVNTASAFFVKDIYQNFLRPRAANRELIFASYGSTIAVVVLGFYFGVTASSINDLWGWIVMSFGGGSLAPGLLRLYWWRCNAWGMFGGILMGGIGAIAQRILYPEMPEWEQLTVMAALSFIGTIGVSLLTPPTPHETLRQFYRTTRPFGWWGPFRDEFKGEDRKAIDRENRNDIITVPFAMLAQVTLFMLSMQWVIKTYDALFYTVPLFLIGAAGMYWFWWRPLFRLPKPITSPPDGTTPPNPR